MRTLSILASMIFSFPALASTHQEKFDDFTYGLYKNSKQAMSQIQVRGERQGLASFAKKHNLVITKAEGYCSPSKQGECSLVIFLTRKSYPLHRPGDKVDRCGIFMEWKASESEMKWRPFNGSARYLNEGNAPLILSLIDDKNRSYCR